MLEDCEPQGISAGVPHVYKSVCRSCRCYHQHNLAKRCSKSEQPSLVHCRHAAFSLTAHLWVPNRQQTTSPSQDGHHAPIQLPAGRHQHQVLCCLTPLLLCHHLARLRHLRRHQTTLNQPSSKLAPRMLPICQASVQQTAKTQALSASGTVVNRHRVSLCVHVCDSLLA